jgi:putative tryptophan/tyrosine transport system substrate-binding protein
MDLLSRRQFVQGSLALAGVGLISGCGLLPRAQQAAKVPRLGYLEPGAEAAGTANLEAFRQGLREHGYIEGENIFIEYRFGDGREERYPDLAAELVSLPVDIIVTSGTSPTTAAKQATTTIPIVVAAIGDMVRTGLVDSLARPGGNITGLTFINPQLRGKQLQLLREAAPGVSRVAVLFYPSGPSTVALNRREMQEGAQALGVQVRALEVGGVEDFEGQFEAAIAGGAGALLVPSDPFFRSHAARIADLALKYRLPTMHDFREYVDAGGLMCYGANRSDFFRRAATYVDKILKGASPADLPVEQPTKFDLVINLKTAQALGLTIPEEVLIQATEVIQ